MRVRALIITTVVALGLSAAAPVPETHADTSLPGVTVGDVTAWEGNAGSLTLKVPIDLSAPSTSNVTMAYAITSDSATTDASDFRARTGKLTFKVGTVSKQLSVIVYGDTTPEPDEHIAVHLGSIVGADAEKPDGGVTVLDDDSGDTGLGLQVEIGDLSVVEADAGKHVASVPLTLSEPAPQMIRVAYSVECQTAESSDYTSKSSGTVTFNIGQRSKALNFVISADTSAEAFVKNIVEHISVALGPAVVRATQGEAVIVDNDGSGAVTGEPGAISIERASVASDGGEGDAPPIDLCDSSWPPPPKTIWGTALSKDGRYEAFASAQSNLVPGDTNGIMDVFVRDLVNHTTERVSLRNDGSEFTSSNVWSGGASRPAISADGRFVAFYSGAASHVYLRDRVAGTTTQVSPHTAASLAPSISDDGRYVVYSSISAETADPLPVQPNGWPADGIYLWDRDSGATQLIAFRSTEIVGQAPEILREYSWGPPVISGNGRYVAFTDSTDSLVPGDTNGCADTFVRDLVTGGTERVSVTTDGTEQATTWYEKCSSSSPVISDDGRYVGFSSAGYNLYPGATSSADLGSGAPADHAYLHDRQTGTTELLDAGFSPETEQADINAISDDGRDVIFDCFCGDPVPTVPSVNDVVSIWLDRQTGAMHEIGVQADGTAPIDEDTGWFTFTIASSISSDGTTIAFTSNATNLVADDANGVQDAFVERLS
jgi:Tol biopolymer transport system component